ncbi:hypothetical protein [Chitinivorax sp. B]|uniref:hypothetical protein n=1 Tax=Chitinivorax sp. B TaxID=2502235 RepID=UPI0010F508F4|nr:hypothetical protein [Chitinivorax sp. B]
MIKRIAMLSVGCLMLGANLVWAEDGPPPLPGDVPGTATAVQASSSAAKSTKRDYLQRKAVTTNKGKRKSAVSKGGKAKAAKAVSAKRGGVAKKAGKKRK